jgi:hypothetical protein
MSTAEMYRRHAADCLQLAQSASSPADRALLMEMAVLWQRLAERAEKTGKDSADT